MIVVGLTGSIGMGKSTTATMFAAEGAPVYDADAEVAKLYAQGGAAVAPLEAAFPGVTKDGAVDRGALRERVLGNPEALQRLESIVHPLVGQNRKGFFAEAKAAGADIVVLDVPLLFESGGVAGVDAIVVVTAPPDVQRERVLAREAMSPDQLDAVLARQMHDAEKRARAHFVIDTSRGLEAARDQVRQVIAVLREPGGLDRHKAALEAGREPSQG
jgi:dephospho-CoA kinase